MKKIRYIINYIMLMFSFLIILLIFFIRGFSSNDIQVYNLFNQKIFIPNNVYSNDLIKNDNMAFIYKSDVSYYDIKIDNLIIYNPNTNNENLFNISIVNDFYISSNNTKKIVLQNGEDINYENQFVGIINNKSKLLYFILTEFSRDFNIGIILICICLSWIVNNIIFLILFNWKKKIKNTNKNIKTSYLTEFNKDIINNKKYKIKKSQNNNIDLKLIFENKYIENNDKTKDLSKILIHKKTKKDIINSKNNMYIQYAGKEK